MDDVNVAMCVATLHELGASLMQGDIKTSSVWLGNLGEAMYVDGFRLWCPA